MSRTNIEKFMRFAIISNICMEPYFRQYLDEIYDCQTNIVNIPLAELQDVNYNEIVINADYIIVLINLKERFPSLIDSVRTEVFSSNDILNIMKMECKAIADYLINKSAAPIFWFSFEDYGIHESKTFGAIPIVNNICGKLNEMLYNLNNPHITFFDMGRIIASIGLSNAYDIRGAYRWNAPYSRELIAEMVMEINRQIKTINGKTKKCVVVDCDNVLWGGIISEDGIDGIKLDSSGLGKEYQYFQYYLKILYDYGIMLAVCSKNDFEDVHRIFNEHNAMILKEEYISCFCVNWTDKVENLKTISSQLNIELNSIVFVDDSEFEIQAVRNILPEVTSILYNKNTIIIELAKYIRLSDNISYQNVFKRQMTYITNRKRNDLRASCASFGEYIESLQMKIEIHLSNEFELNRISELTQRSNKYTNGMRYSSNELRNMMSVGCRLYSIYLKDKYSDLGLIGSIGINGKYLNLFVLSCRALGRNVEQKMFDLLMYNKIEGFDFNSTGKNDHLKLKLIDLIK